MTASEPTCHVLLVDDEGDFVEALATRLRRRGYAVAIALEGDAAARSARQEEPDVVVLDVRMPGADGVTVLGRLKRAHPLTEIILLTGHATVDSALGGMRLGAFDYVLKPVQFDELCARIDAAWARRRAHVTEREVPR